MAIYRSSDAGDATNNVTINEVIDLKEQARISAESAGDDRAAIEAFLGGAGALGDAVDFAEEWAIKATDVAVSVAAGGDATTTFSAAHHAVKSADSASAALASETAAGLSETAAEASEIAAGLSETAAATSAFDANDSFAAADDAAIAALASQTAAGLSETAAGLSETAAGLSETNALASQTAAGLSATAALASETAAGLSQTAAGLSETAAGLSETAAGASEIAAGLSETAAGLSETNALASETAAGLSFTNFDIRYLGAKTSNPTLDNSGGALIAGALYFNSTVSEMRVYNGTAWEPAANIDKATTAQAEAGTDDAAYMTSLKTAQAISAQVQITQSDVRQTVNTGPVDANGRADFIIAGSGLIAETDGLDVTPLNVTFGDGFEVSGKRDLCVVIDADLTWSGLDDDSVNYLYIELDGVNITAGHSALAPIYSQAKPAEPATGQYWYPTDHRGRGQVWDGAAWQPTLRVFVGEATTSGGAVVDVVSYSYQGVSVIENAVIGSGTRTVYTHNIGVLFENIQLDDLKAKLTGAAVGGYSVGDYLSLTNYGMGGVDYTLNCTNNNRRAFGLSFRITLARVNFEGTTSDGTNITNFRLYATIRRRF